MPGPTRPTVSSRREDKVQPPRPPNAWILYRSHQSALLRQTRGNERIAQSAISQLVSAMWKKETEDVRRQFEKLAEEEKLKHQRLYPDYRFCPQKKEAKKARAKKAKARDATPSDASTSTSVTPAMPPVPTIPPPFYWHNGVAIPQQYVLPEVHYGPCGPSPPLSAAPSPVPHETSFSPQPSSDEPVTSSSSSLFAGPSRSSESLPALLQPSVPGEQSLNAHPAQIPSFTPQATVWNNDNEVPGPASWNLERVKLTVPVLHTQNYPGFEQSASSGSQLDPILSTDENGVFNMSPIDSCNITVHPLGELHVAVGDQAPTADYRGQFFVDHDYFEFRKPTASFTPAGLTSPEAVALPPPNEFESLFHHLNSTEVEEYTAAEELQSSASFPHDLMPSWFNLEGTEGSTEELTAIAPHQMHVNNAQQVAAMAIFTQMTNVPAPPASPAPLYVPPSGAVNSSTRRVGGSWKPPFYIPGQTEDSVYSWTFSTN